MVKLRERKRTGFIVLLLLLCVALCFTFTAVFATEGGDPAPAAEEIFLGQAVETERTLSYGGEQKQAEVRIIAPDGGVSTGKQFTADAAGKWSVVYSADFNGHTVTEREVSPWAPSSDTSPSATTTPSRCWTRHPSTRSALPAWAT